MTRLCLALLLCLAPALPLLAQEPEADPLTALPVDEAEENEDFAAFRETLLEAVTARDIDAILEMASEDMQLSFGGAEEQEALRAFLEVDPDQFSAERRFEAPALRERNWAEFETVLRMGGVFDGDGRFIAPYTFAVTPPEGMDPFEVLFVTGSGVALRDRPIRFGAALGWLDHDILRQLDWVAGTPYVQVETASGTKGFVHRDYLRALLDYRAIFERREGAWKLVAFIAGD